jgi:hypothetical protein
VSFRAGRVRVDRHARVVLVDGKPASSARVALRVIAALAHDFADGNCIFMLEPATREPKERRCRC